MYSQLSSPTKVSRRQILPALGAVSASVLVPNRKIFLPPNGGWQKTHIHIDTCETFRMNAQVLACDSHGNIWVMTGARKDREWSKVREFQTMS
jgi:hypothetical protein